MTKAYSGERKASIDYPHETFKHKSQLIRLRTLGEEAFGVPLPPSENCEWALSQRYD